MMLSGVVWRHCDSCPKKFLVLPGVLASKCEGCRDAERKASWMERRRFRTKAKRAARKAA